MMRMLSEGSYDISQERLRQIADEGYDAAHDDEHRDGTIAVIAAELALEHTGAILDHDRCALVRDEWGLVAKHRDIRRRLVIAGALIAAEIDRLDRLAARERGA